jgi:hypothetical protein
MDEISAISAVGSGQQLTAEQKAQVEKLAARDRDVRAHEEAHLAAAGGFADGVQYTYELGPDGKLYAVAGKVDISIPPGLSPEQELAAAEQLRAAAEAPTDPSGQDMAVAAQASALEATAQAEIQKEHAASAKNTAGSPPHTPSHPLDRTA